MIPISSLDVFYLSYDEPQADDFFKDLRKKIPNARRIHGVKGFDAAHKTAARLSRGRHFVTVDADNIIDAAWPNLTIDPDWLQDRTITSWPAKNAVNGVIYGNGAIKIWPKYFVLTMRTHEIAPTSANREGYYDFIYNTDLDRTEGPFHIDLPTPMSTVHANATPEQAFRAGFRAASRLTLVNGVPCLKANAPFAMWPHGLHRLLIWLNVGADARNGLWMIYGARLGALRVGTGELDPILINDLDGFSTYWQKEVKPSFVPKDCTKSLLAEIEKIGNIIKKHSGLNVTMLAPRDSVIFKNNYHPPDLSNRDRFGNMRLRGAGVEANEPDALLQFQAVAETGDANAMQNYGRLLDVGRNVPHDYRRSAEVMREAASMGNAFAIYRLARMHRQGYALGVPKDPARALELFERAADLGLLAAAEAAAEMHANGEAPTSDPEMALFYATVAFHHDPTHRKRVINSRLNLSDTSTTGGS